MNNTGLINDLQKYEEISISDCVLQGDFLPQRVRDFVRSDGNAFVIGLIADQSVKAEIAWTLPFTLKQRLGFWDMAKLSEYRLDILESLLKEKPALHRYPKVIAKYLSEASMHIVENYNGNAYNIWQESPSARIITNRLMAFKGISFKKAMLGCLLLVRDLHYNIQDKQYIDIVYDVHIRRVFLRMGITVQDDYESITGAARKFFPEFPGSLTSAFWSIGRNICFPANPNCLLCPVLAYCEKRI